MNKFFFSQAIMGQSKIQLSYLIALEGPIITVSRGRRDTMKFNWLKHKLFLSIPYDRESLTWGCSHRWLYRKLSANRYHAQFEQALDEMERDGVIRRTDGKSHQGPSTVIIERVPGKECPCNWCERSTELLARMK